MAAGEREVPRTSSERAGAACRPLSVAGKLRVADRVDPGCERSALGAVSSGVDVVRCAFCGEIVGVYEPACLIEADGRVREGSRLTLRAELERPGAVVLHAGCFSARREREQDGGGHSPPAR